MKLTLRNKTFVLKSATLSATIPDPYWLRTYNPKGDTRLFWALDVYAERETEGEMWGPYAYHHNLHFPIRRWLDVAGHNVEWLQRYDKETGEWNGGFYVMEHGGISHARLNFLERKGTSFRFEWEGVCDVFWDDDYGENVPFSILGWAEFTRVMVNGSEADTDATMRDRLAAYLEPGDFIQGQSCSGGHCYQSGVRMAYAMFTPLGAKPAQPIDS